MGTIFSLFMLSFTFDTSLYTYVTWMFMGVVALGFGFAYISRMGEVSTLFTEDFTQAKDAIIENLGGGDKKEMEPIPEPVTSQEELEDDEVEEDEDEVIEIDEEVEIVEEDDEPEEDVEVDTPAKQDEYEYDLQLDSSVMNAIQKSLANTPHEGFKPVVSIASNGNVKIDFVPL